MPDLKNTTHKFRRLSVPTSMQFTRTVKNIDEKNKENIGTDKKVKGNVEKRVSINGFMTCRELPTPTRIQKLNSDEIE